MQRKLSISKIWTGLGFSLALIHGCSFLGGKSDSDSANDLTLGNNNFHATVTQVNNPVPIPIEVAKEISQIAGGHLQPDSPTLFTPENKSHPRQLASETEVVDSRQNNKNVLQKAVATGLPTGKKYPRRAGSHAVRYQVKSGDTLMKIAFENYGNVYRWREIYADNKPLIKDYNVLTAGMLLTIQGVEYLVIERNGKPYLIRKNDTLVKISKFLYGSPKEWQSIWYNNKQLIHDPNKIYAGFTLYYQDKANLHSVNPKLANTAAKAPERKTANVEPVKSPPAKASR